MYKIVYLEDDNRDCLYSVKKSIWCYGRERTITLCQSLYRSPYIFTIIVYDVDDNIVETFGIVD